MGLNIAVNLNVVNNSFHLSLLSITYTKKILSAYQNPPIKPPIIVTQKKKN